MRSIEISKLIELHETSIHRYNAADSDFTSAFWNGYGCAIKAVLERLED